MTLTREKTRWVRCTRQLPCPICGKPDWCSVAEDRSVAMCMRVPGGREIQHDLGAGGLAWVHKLDGTESIPENVDLSRLAAPEPEAPVDFSALAYELAKHVNGQLDYFSEPLGVSQESLSRLVTGWSWSKGCLSFPMRTGGAKVVGIRYRAKDGKKFAERGSKNGLFFDLSMLPYSNHPDTIFVLEGPTDTAAAMSIGLVAVGRASCGTGAAYICDLLERLRRPHVVIVADSDAAGWEGAQTLSTDIRGTAKTIKIIQPGAKDMRAWVAAGATKDDVMDRVRRSAFA